MASRCSTALVEPPSTITIRMAFSNAALVMILRGVRLRSSRSQTARPAASHSSSFCGWTAGVEEVMGRAMPMVSMAAAMVLAVYMPPQAPAPGQACTTTSSSCSSVICLARNCP